MNITPFDPKDIVVPEGRFRPADSQTVDEIVESIKKFGQLQPIIIEDIDDGEPILIDGLHRLEAIKKLGDRKVYAVHRQEVDILFVREMELETNIRRKEMTWQERTYALAELHKIRQSQDPTWGTTQTAEVARVRGPAEVSEAVLITKMIDLFPEIGKAKNKSQALSMAHAKAKLVTAASEASRNIIDYEQLEPKLVLGDSVEVIKTLPDGFCHAIITDPPFGIGYDERVAGTAHSISDYKDDKDSYERLLTMAPHLYRVLKEDGWLVWFLGVSWYERVKTVFREAGFTVDEIPIIWDRSDGRTFTNRPDRYFTRAYDIALHCFKGNPTMVIKSRPNVIRVAPVEGSDRELLVERPVGLYQELIQRLTHPGQRVVDFFAGSGSCLAAAAMLKRDFFGVELSPERRAVALKKISAHIPR